MGTPYTKQQNFDIVGGTTQCVRLNVPYRGTLTRLIVRQTFGTVDGFTLNLFDRADACAGAVEQSSNLDDDTQLHDSAVHQIMAEQTPPGDILELYDLSIPYANQDEQDLTSRRPSDALWMEITVTGEGTKSFDLGFTVDQASDASP